MDHRRRIRGLPLPDLALWGGEFPGTGGCASALQDRPRRLTLPWSRWHAPPFRSRAPGSGVMAPPWPFGRTALMPRPWPSAALTASPSSPAIGYRSQPMPGILGIREPNSLTGNGPHWPDMPRPTARERTECAGIGPRPRVVGFILRPRSQSFRLYPRSARYGAKVRQEILEITVTG